jgi:hypothetical protein
MSNEPEFYSYTDVRRVRRKLAKLGLKLRTEQAYNCTLAVWDSDGERRLYLGWEGDGGIVALEQWIDNGCPQHRGEWQK